MTKEYERSTHHPHLFRRRTESISVEEWYTRQAYEYRSAEAVYYNGLKRQSEMVPVPPSIISNPIALNRFAYHRYSRNLTISFAQRNMESLEERLVIGGADGERGIYTFDTYDSKLHTNVIYDEDIEFPVEGREIIIAGSEIGRMQNGEYRQILPAVYTLPNYFKDIETETFRKIFHEAKRLMNQNE